MCGPVGDIRRQQLTRLLNDLKRDNQYVINAMLNAGQHVADTVIELNLEYEPATGLDKISERQPFYGLAGMLEQGTFRCGDGSAYEAAVMEEKYGIPSMVVVVPQGDSQYHGLYVTPDGPIDVVENWLRYWEARVAQRPADIPKVDAPPAKVNAACRIDGGRVTCDAEEDTSSCCVDWSGRWRCPGDHPLHGRDANVRAYKRRGAQRWALVGGDRIPVPVCPGGGR